VSVDLCVCLCVCLVVFLSYCLHTPFTRSLPYWSAGRLWCAVVCGSVDGWLADRQTNIPRVSCLLMCCYKGPLPPMRTKLSIPYMHTYIRTSMSCVRACASINVSTVLTSSADYASYTHIHTQRCFLSSVSTPVCPQSSFFLPLPALPHSLPPACIPVCPHPSLHACAAYITLIREGLWVDN